MKYVVLLGDGMADNPLEEMGGKTPLQVAETPNMDAIAKKGRSGLLTTIPEGMPAGSDVANLAIMGYDPKSYYTGRGALEAASMGVDLEEDDVAFRCNLITVKDGRIMDYSAGHISTEDATGIIHTLQEQLRDYGGHFHPGISYRHLFVTKEGADLEFAAPHDHIGETVEENLNKEAGRLNELILKSQEVLADQPAANSIWLWGQGKRPSMEPLKEKWRITGAVISAVDLIKGIGKYAGMEIIDVPGATGYYDTDYEAKADHALEALVSNDYVYVHVEAPDEAAHSGDIDKKIECIEEFDRRVVGRVLDGLSGEYTVAVLPDHFTPISVRTHTPEPVPFAIYSTKEKGDSVEHFDEESATGGALGHLQGEDFMRALLGR